MKRDILIEKKTKTEATRNKAISDIFLEMCVWKFLKNKSF